MIHLLEQIEEYDYAILIGYPDDKISIDGNEVHFVTRDNVILEYGLFLSKLGKDNTFFFKPTLPNNTLKFKMPSDIGKNAILELYSLDYNNDGFVFRGFNDSDLFINKIKKCEKNKAINSTKSLTDLVNCAQNRIKENTKGQKQSLRIFRDHIDQIFLKKEDETSKELNELLCDALDAIRDIIDFCKPEDLSNLQSIDKGLTEVWVFADNPLEFQPASSSKDYVQSLRETIKKNLVNGVRYIYFVSKNFKVINVEEYFCNDKNVLKNITFIYIEPLHFKTYFTLHFTNDPIPSEIYMSALLNDRDDLLIKIDEQLHIERIYRRLLKIKGDRSTNGFEQINYVFDD